MGVVKVRSVQGHEYYVMCTGHTSLSKTIWLHPLSQFPRGNSRPLYAKQVHGRWIQTRATGDSEPGWVLTQACDADQAWLQSQGFSHVEASH